MTQREKLLAAVVGLLGLVILTFYTVSRVGDAYALRANKKLELEGAVRNQQRVIRFGRAAQRELDGYLEKSLPADRPLAEAQYVSWLLRQASQAGFAGVKVGPTTARPHGDLYWRTGFVVMGTGDLPQLIAFLHEFYSVDYLHRIERLSVKPINNSKTLDLQINVHALSMNKSKNERLEPRAAERLKYNEVEPYVEAIAHRNFFAPANKPPKFEGPTSQKGNPNRLVTFRSRVKDPEEDDLSYRLDGEPPEGATIDAKSGEFRWTPPELGDYEIDICVTDTGLPPKSATQTVKISVVEPPPEKPRTGFDPATQAKITGFTDAAESLVWITVQTEGKVLMLKEGDRISVGTVKGVVQKIFAKEKEAKFATDDGREIVVGLGKTLVPDAASPISGI